MPASLDGGAPQRAGACGYGLSESAGTARQHGPSRPPPERLPRQQAASRMPLFHRSEDSANGWPVSARAARPPSGSPRGQAYSRGACLSGATRKNPPVEPGVDGRRNLRAPLRDQAILEETAPRAVLIALVHGIDADEAGTVVGGGRDAQQSGRYNPGSSSNAAAAPCSPTQVVEMRHRDAG